MKTILTILLFTCILFAEEENYILTVEATGFQNNKGEAQFSLYNKEGSIPDKHLNKYYKTLRVKIDHRYAKAVFKNLPKGRYAVSLYHDKNCNHKIDKGMFMPVEGIGLSNFESVSLFHLPNFKDASFTLNKNKTIRLKVINL